MEATPGAALEGRESDYGLPSAACVESVSVHQRRAGGKPSRKAVCHARSISEEPASPKLCHAAGSIYGRYQECDVGTAPHQHAAVVATERPRADNQKPHDSLLFFLEHQRSLPRTARALAARAVALGTGAAGPGPRRGTRRSRSRTPRPAARHSSGRPRGRCQWCLAPHGSAFN